MNMVIKNAVIVDGSNTERYKADIGIYENIITEIGNLDERNYDKVIDANGKIVSPGFIDTHSHSDLFVLQDPTLKPKIMQGITTEILGQDGISMAPLPLEYIKPWRKNLAGLDGDSENINWEYRTTEGYLNEIESKRPATNICYLVPHGNIRMEAIGLTNRQPNEEEIGKMRDIVKREMEAGAIGISTGLIYMPCAYSRKKEIIEICKVAAKYDGIFVVHQRSEADDILDSMDEVLSIGREAGIKIHFSHFKVCGKKNWNKIDKVIEKIEAGVKEGLKISFDQYPYVAGSTTLGVILPPWVHDGGTDKLLERLCDKSLREKMIYDMENGIPGWDNFIEFAGLENIYVTSVKTDKNKQLVGKSLIEIGEIKNKDPYNAVFDLLYEEENAVSMVDFYGTEEHVKKIMKLPEMNLCTDGLLGEGKPHPRVYGAFPRFLGKYVREEKTLTLEEAIYKITYKPAKTFNIHKRGLIKSGYYADIVVFDQNTITDNGTYVDPMQYPSGIEYVFVNGKIVVNKGEYYNNRAGTIIKRK